MRKLTIPLAAVAAFALMGINSQETKAQGLHFHAGGLHIDVGNPHGRYGGRRWAGYQPRHYGRRYRPRWHDTTHWDYHPGEHVRHGNHYHYIPGHFDLHRSGHWHP